MTFAHFGERGSTDIVGLRRAASVALIVEIKTELTAIDDTIRRLDVKDRLAAEIVRERFGWKPTTVARLLVVLDGTTARRRVASHDRALQVAFPDRGRADAGLARRPARTPQRRCCSSGRELTTAGYQTGVVRDGPIEP